MTKHDTANPGRRSMFGLAVGLTAALTTTSAVAVQSARAEGSDAKLQELGEEFDRLLAIELDARRAFNPIDDRFNAIVAEGGGLASASARERALALCPERHEAWKVFNENAIAIEAILDEGLSITPENLVGVAVQLRLLRYRVTDDGLARYDDDGNIDEIYNCFTDLLRHVEAAAQQEAGRRTA